MPSCPCRCRQAHARPPGVPCRLGLPRCGGRGATSRGASGSSRGRMPRMWAVGPRSPSRWAAVSLTCCCLAESKSESVSRTRVLLPRETHRCCQLMTGDAIRPSALMLSFAAGNAGRTERENSSTLELTEYEFHSTILFPRTKITTPTSGSRP